MHKLITLSLALSFLLTLANCASGSKKETTQPPTAYEKTVSNMEENQEAYIARITARIDELAKSSGDLKEKAKDVSNPNRKKLSNAADDLKVLLKDARKELNEVRSAAPANWIDEKRDVERVLSRAESQYSLSVQLLK